MGCTQSLLKSKDRFKRRDRHLKSSSTETVSSDLDPIELHCLICGRSNFLKQGIPSMECQHCYLSVVRRDDKLTHIKGHKDLRMKRNRQEATTKPVQIFKEKSRRDETLTPSMKGYSVLWTPKTRDTRNARESICSSASGEEMRGMVSYEDIYAHRTKDYMEESFEQFDTNKV